MLAGLRFSSPCGPGAERPLRFSSARLRRIKVARLCAFSPARGAGLLFVQRCVASAVGCLSHGLALLVIALIGTYPGMQPFGSAEYGSHLFSPVKCRGMTLAI